MRMQLPVIGADMCRARMRMICPGYPAVNIYSRPARVMTSLGPVCVATAVNEIPGWDAELVDENNCRLAPRDAQGRPDQVAIQRGRPAQVIGLYGGLTSTIPRLLEIAQQYKRMGAITVAGGQHFVEENVEQALRGGVDVVVLGEGEQAIGELLSCFQRGGDLSGIRGIAYLDDGAVVITPPREHMNAFDQLPLPDFSLLRYGRLKVFPVSGTRGCRMKCEFCAVKGKPRFASARRMLEQFAAIYEKQGGRVFFIVDDLFGQNRAETLELCRMLRDYQRQMGTRFAITVQIRLDKSRDTELLTAMREAGVRILAIGFESPIAEELKAMDKHLKPQDMLDLVKLYHKAGFRIHGMFIFGYPAQEGRPFYMSASERVRRFRRFIRKGRLDTVQVLLPIPLPGTALTDRLRASNRILPEDCVGLKYYDGNFPVIRPDEPLTPEEMQAAAQKIMGYFYRPRSMVHIGLYILLLPMIVFRFRHLQAAWRVWYRRWKRNVYRTGGWLLMRRWSAALKQEDFSERLAQAKRAMAQVERRPLVNSPD